MRDRFHGRQPDAERNCNWPGCDDRGEFRAPAIGRTSRSDGPGDWQWLCLDHVRAFNAGYDYFRGMSRDEIEAAQRPMAGWATESRVFASGGVDAPPPWADFADPLEAISGRFRTRMREAAPAERDDKLHLSQQERAALSTLGLGINAGKAEIRKRYSALARQLHPDRNGGDRSTETRLQRVVEAYQLLRKSLIFG